MRLKTILNFGLKFKCFCIGKSEFNEKKDSIIVEIKARTNSKPVCSICGTASPGYDTLPERLFEFVSVVGLSSYSFAIPCAGQLSECKRVVVEMVSWSDGKSHFCITIAVSGKFGPKSSRGKVLPNISYIMADSLLRC